MSDSNLLSHIFSELSLQKAFDHIERFVSMGARLAGTEAVDKAADYIQHSMEEYGLETKMDTFKVYNSYPGEAVLELVSPQQDKLIECRSYAHILSTPQSGIEGELVYIGAGEEENYSGIDVEGKLLLTDMHLGPARPEKARIAADHGAKALLVMDLGNEQHQPISNGAIKGVWGNPTTETIKEIPQIAAAGLAKHDGLFLMDLLEQGRKVLVRLKATCSTQWQEVSQPFGVVEGVQEPDKFVLVSGHFEAWGPGATDNAAGNAVMLELARVFAKYRERLRRSVWFAFWNGHEVAEASGSAWFADNYWDMLRDGAVAHINIDQPGLRGSDVFQVFSTLEIENFARDIGSAALGEKVIYAPLVGKHSDQSFYGLGIPSLLGGTIFSDEKLQEMDGASLGWWWHTEEDTLDKVDLQVLHKSMKAFGSYAIGLANADVLPLDLVAPMGVMQEKFRTLQNKIGKIPIDIDSLVSNIDALKPVVMKIEELKNKRQYQVINRCLMQLSRVFIRILYTLRSNYEQSSYGRSELQKMIPLFSLLQNLMKVDEGSPEYTMLFTESIRERNRISDLIQSAIALAEKCIADD